MKGHTTSPEGEPAGALWQCPANSPRRILVVDEDRDLRLRYAFVLTRPGYQVEVAEDGAAGWEALQACRYHLLITENDLPNLTGIELVKRLRAARMALPVVMASGRVPTDELARNPSLRLAATLEKPFPVDELLHTVENILHRPRPVSMARQQERPGDRREALAGQTRNLHL